MKPDKEQIASWVKKYGKDKLVFKLAETLPRETVQFVLDQINGERIATKKLPFLLELEGIHYPSKQAMEQCSSEATASYKSQLLSGKSFLDLTGGFGIDTTFFAQRFEQVTYVEREASLFEVAQHNFKTMAPSLGKEVKTVHGDSEDFLKNLKEPVDAIYLDPARRDKHKRFKSLEDYYPDVVSLKETLLKKAKQVLVKLSPMLDVQLLLEKLNFQVAEIHIVSLRNECKEILLLLQKAPHPNSHPALFCVNIEKEQTQIYSSSFGQEKQYTPEFAHPQGYLYEPNASIFKAGIFKELAVKFDLKKLHSNTHLYSSEELNKDFPGKIYQIINELKTDKKVFKKHYPEKRFHIKTRNHSLSAPELGKKMGLKEGGNLYLFGTSSFEKKNILLVAKLLHF